LQANGDITQEQSKSDVNAGDNSFDWTAAGRWLNFGIAAAQQGLAAVGDDFASISSASSSEADSSSKNGGNPVVVMDGKAPNSGGGVDVPQIALPEPGTVGLLMLGGSALVAGTRCRRKQAA
jgi:hypothetical protein